MNTKAPWYKYYREVPHTIDYPDYSIFEQIAQTSKKYPKNIAYDFMGALTTYKEMVEEIHTVAKAFKALGICEGDRVTVCMPNTPQAVLCFYAINLIGAVSNMVHPLSSEGEIEFYLKDAASSVVITLDQFYPKFDSIRKCHPIKDLIITSVADALTPLMRIGYALTEGRKTAPVPQDADVCMWKDFLKMGAAFTGEYINLKKANDPAVILYSGGTTGKTKGILLSNLNFNALALQTATMGDCCVPGNSMLSVMPIFHGFGLGVCIHTMLSAGCKCILIPRFNAESYAKLLRKKQPNYIAGVPTLFEAILRNPDMENVNLSCLMGVFSGGDSLSVELKKKFDKFLKERGSCVSIREGYGTTECVTASCLTPKHHFREGSIGVPYPDMYYTIVNPETNEELPYGSEGEICIMGPTVMLEYANQPEETANTLRRHADGNTWLHTGDLGIMDSDGFVYFKQRMKRMIITSGYNVYPSQIENVIDSHDAVLMSCVIGVPDPLKIQKVKAFVMLRPNACWNEELKEDLYRHCKKNVAAYAMPYEIEVRDQLPKTLVGKVAYKILEQEELEKREEISIPEGSVPAN